MHKGVGAIQSQSRFQLFFRQVILFFPQVIESQVCMRAGKLRVQTNGGLIIGIRFVDAAKPGLSDANEVVQGSVRRPQAPRLLKLLQRRLVFLLLKEFQAALQRITLLSESGEANKQGCEKEGTAYPYAVEVRKHGFTVYVPLEQKTCRRNRLFIRVFYGPWGHLRR